MRVLHVILDEKFIDNAVGIFDALDGIHNEYLLVSAGGPIRIIHAARRVTVFRSQRARLGYIRHAHADAIVLHALSFGATLVPFVSGRTPLVWISWGGDLYRDSADRFVPSYPFRRPLFMPETRAWLSSQRRAGLGVVRGWLISLLRDRLRAAAIRKIGYLSTCLPYEFGEVQRRYPHFKRFEFDYIDRTALSLPRCAGSDILVGNSASINCNHLDVLEIMRRSGATSSRVMVPLSYAGDETYRSAVIQKGISIFGDRFVALTRFMEIAEYLTLLKGCGFAVFGFLRQQATKNIQLLFFQGSKVFFYRDTDMYRYFKETGYAVFSIDEDLTGDGLARRLSDEDFQRNRELVTAQFDYDANLRAAARSLAAVAAGG